MEKINNPTNIVDEIVSTPFMHTYDFLKKAEARNRNRLGTRELSVEDYEQFVVDEENPNERTNTKNQVAMAAAEKEAVLYLKRNNTELTLLRIRKATMMFMRINNRRKTYLLN